MGSDSHFLLARRDGVAYFTRLERTRRDANVSSTILIPPTTPGMCSLCNQAHRGLQSLSTSPKCRFSKTMVKFSMLQKPFPKIPEGKAFMSIAGRTTDDMCRVQTRNGHCNQNLSEEKIEPKLF